MNWSRFADALMLPSFVALIVGIVWRSSARSRFQTCRELGVWTDSLGGYPSSCSPVSPWPTLLIVLGAIGLVVGVAMAVGARKS